MSELVPSDKIEGIVGSKRHPAKHLARAVSTEEIVYILHSQKCRDLTPDLRDCPYSIALSKGIDEDLWEGRFDRVVGISIKNRRIVPTRRPRP